MKLGRVCMVLGFFAVFLPTHAQAESSSTEPQARGIVRRGTLEVGAMAGYLQGNDTLTSISSNRSAVYALPRVGVVATPDVGSGFYAGDLKLLLEALYS